jgi:hypothetical protein
MGEACLAEDAKLHRAFSFFRFPLENLLVLPVHFNVYPKNLCFYPPVKATGRKTETSRPVAPVRLTELK